MLQEEYQRSLSSFSHRDDKLIACATSHQLGGCCWLLTHIGGLRAVLGHHTSLLDVLCAFTWRRCRPLRDKAAIKCRSVSGAPSIYIMSLMQSLTQSCDPFLPLRLTEQREKPLICSSRGRNNSKGRREQVAANSGASYVGLRDKGTAMSTTVRSFKTAY